MSRTKLRVNLKPTQLQALVEDIRTAVAHWSVTEDLAKLPARALAECVQVVLTERYGIAPLVPCTGEAHSNAYIDHCGVCMPRWGLVEKKEGK